MFSQRAHGPTSKSWRSRGQGGLECACAISIAVRMPGRIERKPAPRNLMPSCGPPHSRRNASPHRWSWRQPRAGRGPPERGANGATNYRGGRAARSRSNIGGSKVGRPGAASRHRAPRMAPGAWLAKRAGVPNITITASGTKSTPTAHGINKYMTTEQTRRFPDDPIPTASKASSIRGQRHAGALAPRTRVLLQTPDQIGRQRAQAALRSPWWPPQSGI